MVRRVAGDGVRDERAEALALDEPDVGGEARRGHRGAPEPVPQREHALDVVEVVVRHRDPTRAAARLDLGGHRVEVLGQVRPGVDDPRRVAPDDPGVRARQRERPGVVGAHARDVQAREVAHRETSRNTEPPSDTA